MLRKPLITLVIIAAISLAIIAAFYFFFLGGNKTYYYVMIDNTKITETVSDGGVVNFSGSLPYTYTLNAYDANGNRREISFGTSRELREGAILILTYSPLRGVTKWQEIHESDLPERIKAWGGL